MTKEYDWEFERIVALWEEIPRQGLRQTYRAYSGIIYTCQKKKRFSEAVDYYKRWLTFELPKGSVVVLHTFHVMLKIAWEAGDVGMAREVFQEMLARSFPTVTSFNYLLEVYEVQNCPLSGALALVEDMKGRSLLPDSQTYGCLVSIALRNGLAKEAASMWERMKQSGVLPQREACGKYVRALVAVRDVAGALKVFEEAKEFESVTPDAFLSLISACLMDRALEVHVEGLIRDLESIPLVTHKDHRSFALALATVGQANRAIDHLVMLKANYDIHPGRGMCMTLLDHLRFLNAPPEVIFRAESVLPFS